MAARAWARGGTAGQGRSYCCPAVRWCPRWLKRGLALLNVHNGCKQCNLTLCAAPAGQSSGVLSRAEDLQIGPISSRHNFVGAPLALMLHRCQRFLHLEELLLDAFSFTAR